jgi:hypothetical protein
VNPATGEDFALVLPAANAEAMNLFLARFASALPEGTHALMVLDGAGYHGRAALDVPKNVTLLTLPPYSPELNPIERVFLHLKDRYLSFRHLPDDKAVLDAVCTAWNALRAEPDRLRTLCAYPWITKVVS